MSAIEKIAVVLILCLAAVLLGGIFWFKSPIDKQDLLKYIEQEEFQYDLRYLIALKRFVSKGDREITAMLARKYIGTTSIRLFPDEKPGSRAPAKYRPYRKSNEEKLRFGRGKSTHELFDYIDFFEHLSPGAIVICDICLEELRRMRRDGVIDSSRVASIMILLRGHNLVIYDQKIEHRELSCELVYVYACYEYWPSIRHDIDLILSCIDGGRLSEKMLLMVDDEGIESAIDYIDSDLFSKFKESGNLHKKAAPPIGVDLMEKI